MNPNNGPAAARGNRSSGDNRLPKEALESTSQLDSLEDVFGEDIYSVAEPQTQAPIHVSPPTQDEILKAVTAEAAAGLLDPLPALYRETVHTQNRVGDYVLGKTIGEGAFAKVKLATHVVTGARVAIKLVLKARITSPYVRENLVREGRLMRQFATHPNIVRLIEIIDTDQAYCVVTEYAAGGELLDYVVAHGRLAESDARRFMRQLASAVAHLHSCGVVHRDLKVENLLLDEHLNLKLIDFGLSNLRDGKLQTQCGSPAYSAPELLSGAAYGKAVDLWSMGINMYAMLTGALPYNCGNVAELHRAILNGSYEEPAGVSDACRQCLHRLLTVDAEQRVTAEQLLEDPWLTAEGSHAIPRAAAVPPQGVSVVPELARRVVTAGRGYSLARVMHSVNLAICDGPHALYSLLQMKAASGNPKPAKASRTVSVGAAPSSPFVAPLARAAPAPNVGAVLRRDTNRGPTGRQRSRPSSMLVPGTLDAVFEGHTAADKSSSLRREARGRNKSTSNATPPASPRLSRRIVPATSNSGHCPPSPASKEQWRCPPLSKPKRKTFSLPRNLGLHSHTGADGFSTSFGALYDTSAGDTTQVKSMRFPVSKEMMSQKAPQAVLQQLKDALATTKVQFHPDMFGLPCMHCTKGDITFEVEVVRLAGLSVHGLRFHRLKGDALEYKELCRQLMQVAALDGPTGCRA